MSALPSSMNEPQRAGSVTRTSMSGKRHATGQPPQQTHSERNKPSRWFRAKQPVMLADQTRTRRGDA
jgi:hypothetical protein